MEEAGGETPRSPEPSFLATLGDPQVTLVSVHKRWSFRRNPGARGSSRPVTSEEEGECSLKVLNGTRGIRSNQVSAIAKGVKSRGGVGRGLQMEASPMSWELGLREAGLGKGARGKVDLQRRKSITVTLWFCCLFLGYFVCLCGAEVLQKATQTKMDFPLFLFFFWMCTLYC